MDPRAVSGVGPAADEAEKTLRRAFAARRTRSWADPAGTAPQANCLVVILSEEEARRRLEPVGAAAQPSPPTGSAVVESLVERVCAEIPLSEIAPRLLRAANGALIDALLAHIQEGTAGSPILMRYPRVRDAIILAASLDSPVLSVNALARQVGLGPRRFQDLWAEAARELAAIAGFPMLPPKRFLMSLLFLRALRSWLSNGPRRPTWRDVAASLGVTPKTLRNLVVNLGDETPSELRIEQVSMLVMRLERHAFAALITSRKGG